MTLISVIVPAFNEEECIEELSRRLQQVFARNPRYDFEVVIVENGSTDTTWTLVQQICKADSRFKTVRLSRNFRMDGGLTAGLKYVEGDAAILMTADLQDPPELISDFLAKWEEGYENIYMVVSRRIGSHVVRRINSRLFYWFASKLSGEVIPTDASDYRLVDRKVYEVVREMNERNRFVRGLFAWVGFRSIGIQAERPPRYAGKSNAHSLKVLDLALKGIFAHSYIPLKVITVTGLSLSVLSLLTIIPLGVTWALAGVPFAGFGTLVAGGLLLFGVLAFMIGLVAEYVGLIYEEVKGRPNFIVSESFGFKK